MELKILRMALNFILLYLQLNNILTLAVLFSTIESRAALRQKPSGRMRTARKREMAAAALRRKCALGRTLFYFIGNPVVRRT